MSMYPPFTPGLGAVVTAAVGASSLSIPSAYLSRPAQVEIQVAAGANAAVSFTGTAEAPDGTPDGKAIPILGGNAVVWTIPQSATAISYIRVGASDATVYFTFGNGS
jgi:hypothetical protein